MKKLLSIALLCGCVEVSQYAMKKEVPAMPSKRPSCSGGTCSLRQLSADLEENGKGTREPLREEVSQNPEEMLIEEGVLLDRDSLADSSSTDLLEDYVAPMPPSSPPSSRVEQPGYITKLPYELIAPEYSVRLPDLTLD